MSLPEGGKSLMMYTRFDTIPVRDRQMERLGITILCSACIGMLMGNENRPISATFIINNKVTLLFTEP